MAGKISELSEITSVATGDFIETLDVSDTSGGASGTNKKITQNNFLATAMLLTGNQSISGTKTFDALTIVEGTSPTNAINFGSDTNLYRLSSNSLKTDDALSVASGLFVENTANLATAGINGALKLSGTSFGSYDVNLYASATDTLKTDDNFIVGGTVGSGAGNAVTVDGTQTLTNKTLTSPLYLGTINGWIGANETWTYASATTITVPTDATLKYAIGDRIRLTQGGGYKYFYIVTVAATLLTITGGTSYTLANAAIADQDYSHVASPVGFPQWFSFSEGYTGFSAAPSSGMNFSIVGRNLTIVSDAKIGTSNTTGFTITGLPVSAVTQFNKTQIVVRDNSADQFGTFRFTAATTLTIETGASGGTWTASATKGILSLVFTYRI